MTPASPGPSFAHPTTLGEATQTDAYLAGTGTPLLLLHGIYMSWRAWRPVLSTLARHHRVYAPTLAGHRDGPILPPDATGIAPFADAVERQLDALGWDSVHIAGNSLGGWLALELAERGRAQSVVALSPAGSWATYADYLRLVAQLKLLGTLSASPGAAKLLRQRLVRFVVMRTVSDQPRRITDADVAELVRDARDCRALEPLLSWMQVHGRLGPFELPDIPVRIAWPEEDRTISWERYGRAYRRLTPRAEFVRLDGVGHVPMYDNPPLVSDTILSVTEPR